MRRVGFRGAQAPCAAAGKVRPDPFPLRNSVLCVDLNGSVRVFRALHRGQLVNPVQWKRTLPEFGFSVGVAEQLGSVRAHWAHGAGLFG